MTHRRLARPLAVRSIVVTAVAGLALSLAPATAQAAQAPIPASYFGVHHGGLHAEGPVGWPAAPVGSVRLWDNGVSWREIEKAPGVYDWSLLDRHVAKARANGASVLLVLGQTPTFHSTNPAATGYYGPGATAMPTQASWTAYVQAVARRNLDVYGGVLDFQVWNEANVIGFWSGTPTQMATLTAWTAKALDAVDRSATLVAPALVTRLSSQQTWIRAFYAQRVAKKHVSSYVDALSFQLYPVATGSPESSMALLATVRKTLKKHKVTKPIWNTEVNYGLIGGPQSGAAVPALSADRQVGNVLRTYVLNAQHGVGRVYWYSFDLLSMSNTRLVAEDRVTLTEAGRAFATARSWLQGTRPVSCTVRKGTHTCLFTKGKEQRRVIWNPSRSAKVTLPAKATVTAWDAASAAKARSVKVGPVPVLVRSR